MSTWIRPCDTGACLEFQPQPDGGVLLRNSQDPDRTVTASAVEWLGFGRLVAEAILGQPLDTLWWVQHPGVGVLGYPDGQAASAAAGTAGRIIPPAGARA